MNEKFTPGPWNKKEINICSQHKAGLSLAFLTTSDWRKQEEGKANAHLIAAAPDMYEALVDLFHEADSGCECGKCIACKTDAKVRAALAKARGEA